MVSPGWYCSVAWASDPLRLVEQPQHRPFCRRQGRRWRVWPSGYSRRSRRDGRRFVEVNRSAQDILDDRCHLLLEDEAGDVDGDACAPSCEAEELEALHGSEVADAVREVTNQHPPAEHECDDRHDGGHYVDREPVDPAALQLVDLTCVDGGMGGHRRDVAVERVHGRSNDTFAPFDASDVVGVASNDRAKGVEPTGVVVGLHAEISHRSGETLYGASELFDTSDEITIDAALLGPVLSITLCHARECCRNGLFGRFAFLLPFGRHYYPFRVGLCGRTTACVDCRRCTWSQCCAITYARYLTPDLYLQSYYQCQIYRTYMV